MTAYAVTPLAYALFGTAVVMVLLGNRRPEGSGRARRSGAAFALVALGACLILANR